MAPGPQRWARVPPRPVWKRPSLPQGWVRVLVRHLEGAQALPGYVWLEMPHKIQHMPERQLEFRMLA
jgi:hypothetical protein